MSPPLERDLDPPPTNSSPFMDRVMCSCLVIPISLGLLLMLNIAAFIVVAIILGGDAINGHAQDGHYFLRAHGKDTEKIMSVQLQPNSRLHSLRFSCSLPARRSRRVLAE